MGRRRTSYGYEKGLIIKATHKLLFIAACCISTPAFAAGKLSIRELLNKYVANRNKRISTRENPNFREGINNMAVSYFNFCQNFVVTSVVITSILLMPLTSQGRLFAGNETEKMTSLERIKEMVALNESLFSLIKMDYTTRKSTSIPVSISDVVPKDPTRSRTVEDSGASYVKSTWAQDDIKQHLNLNMHSNSNEWKSGFVNVVDGEVAKAGTLPDLMSGYITNATDFRWGMIDTMNLGLRPITGQHKLSELLVKEHASFDGEIDVIDERKAYVVGIKRPGKPSFTRMWIDCERGMPIRWKHYDRHPDSNGARLTSEVKTIELHQLPNGGWFPVKGTRAVHHRSPKHFLSFDHITVDVNSITIKREDIPDSLFTIEYPEGAKVYNAIIGSHIKVVRTLLGKSLPEFEGIDLDVTVEDIRDKAILICFFDINQRPSRNCLLQLSKRAQKLKAKDVIMVAVQASKVDDSVLNEWVEKNKIPLSVGMIQGDEEKIRFSWGVKSLPWLILTDTEHVVTAEGFSVAELDEKLNGNSH